jgi:hypothetical protein
MESAFQQLVSQWEALCHNITRFDDDRMELLRCHPPSKCDNPALLKLVFTNSHVELLHEPLCIEEDGTAPIHRSGDLPVGFYLEASEAAICLELWIGGMFIGTIQLQPHQETFAFGNCHCLPVIGMQYQDIRVKMVGNERPIIRVIQALLRSELRKIVASSTIVFEAELAVAFSGMFGGCMRGAISWVADSPDMRAYPLSIPPIARVLELSGSVCSFPNLAKLIDNGF